MSDSYVTVQWNAHKRTYDLLIAAGVVLFLGVFVGLTFALHPSPGDLSPPVVVLRATAVCAFLMLHLILCIGPLARLTPKALPLLYNRRHLGVSAFLVALVHGLLATMVYQGMGDANPITSIFTANPRYDSIAQFPFQVLGVFGLTVMFLMAATSHDYWLKNLTPGMWKALHMWVYVAYAALVGHVALGALQAEPNPVYAGLLVLGVAVVSGLHLAAGMRETTKDGSASEQDGWVRAGRVDEIDPDCALVVALPGDERVAIFRSEAGLSALSNVCAHQGGPLGEGRIVDGCITCPWHGYQYLAGNGQSPPPFTEKVPTYRLKLEGDEVWVDARANPPGTPVDPLPIPSTLEAARG